jgi:mRNA interferase MazF
MSIKRGEIYLANLGNVKHTDIGKIRPVLIFQNDHLNRMVADELYDDVIIIPLSSKMKESDFTFSLRKRDKLEKNSTILCHAIKMIASKRILLNEGKLTTLNESEMKEIEKRISLVLGMNNGK